MLIPYPLNIAKYPYLTVPIKDEHLLSRSLKGFSEQGYKLTELEHYIYAGNNIDFANNGYSGYEWYFNKSDNRNIILDYAYIGIRYSIAGQLRDQLYSLVKHRVELKQLLNLKPLYGLKLSLREINKNHINELFKINYNTHNYDELSKSVNLYQKNISYINKSVII